MMSCTCRQQNLACQDLIRHYTEVSDSGLFPFFHFVFFLKLKKIFRIAHVQIRGEKSSGQLVRLPPQWRDGTSQDSRAITQTRARHFCDVAGTSGISSVLRRLLVQYSSHTCHNGTFAWVKHHAGRKEGKYYQNLSCVLSVVQIVLHHAMYLWSALRFLWIHNRCWCHEPMNSCFVPIPSSIIQSFLGWNEKNIRIK